MTAPVFPHKLRGLETFDYVITVRDDNFIRIENRRGLRFGGNHREAYNKLQNLRLQLNRVQKYLVEQYPQLTKMNTEKA